MTPSADVNDITLLSDLIDQLSPAPQPAPIAWIPQTWGWAVLAMGLLALLLFIGVRRWRHWQANAYRRDALRELDLRLSQEGTSVLAEVLKRTALSAYPRELVAGLSGSRWWQFLDQTLPTTPSPASRRFDGPLGQEVSAGAYRDSAASPSAALTQLARQWIRKHRTDAPTPHHDQGADR
ncbi:MULTISPECIES: DUF4381 domain-containing protein [unclassified Halomonas]|uniref:DUF4381 domain-containing protein n=1 Tax=unclassified Halomonas TaxID=2609666 RepID=UPI001C9803A4|nr:MULTISPECIES: DUF4381 domain-containing protein [unclassified Halomonas]MBY5924436.1 DUF4381 domain-containing protein [Halomonas sp. DP4Y7-2]MBY5929853.1 DUF4381 domain-containing protein [Halomonas sp. DP8Y7-3]MBY6231478.1 DUF4381 domain-containing protein [Halomonas sp. DP4Y7-1]